MPTEIDERPPILPYRTDPATRHRSVRARLPGLRHLTGTELRSGLVVAALLTYGGGVVMFVLHARIRQEAGPLISDVEHWALDSSLGFLALSPVAIAVLTWATRRWGATHRAAVAAGALFALATTPGPLLHDHLVGGGTVGADLVTRLLGPDPVVALRPTAEHSALGECLLQLAVGLPVYTAITGVVVAALRAGYLARRPLTTVDHPDPSEEP